MPRKHFPPSDPRGWPEVSGDPPTVPVPQTPNRADWLSVFEQTCTATLIDPFDRPRHTLGRPRPDLWRDDVGRHTDADGNHIADSAEHAGELPHDDGVDTDQPYTVVHPDQFPEG